MLTDHLQSKIQKAESGHRAVSHEIASSVLNTYLLYSTVKEAQAQMAQYVYTTLARST